jgi:CRP-like cAMP-binding protein
MNGIRASKLHVCTIFRSLVVHNLLSLRTHVATSHIFMLARRLSSSRPPQKRATGRQYWYADGSTIYYSNRRLQTERVAPVSKLSYRRYGIFNFYGIGF